MNKTSRGTSSSRVGEQAVTIKHGNAPEIQAVNISVKKKRQGIPLENDVDSYTNASEEPFRRRRPVSKTMTTTKSTMTNEEDYQQIEISKYMDDDNASHTTLSHQPVELDAESRLNDVIHISIGNEEQHAEDRKSLPWKMAPKVHFPVHDESSFSSPVPMESLPEFENAASTSTKSVEWKQLKNFAVIDPPYEHRPHKSYLVQENHKHDQSSPLKVWPGYGGNIYFEPVLVKSKPICQRNDQDAGTRSRSRATSKYTYGDTVTSPDGLSDSRYFSIPPSTPIHPSEARRDTPNTPYRFVNSMYEDELPFQRKMAHLDRDYILNMKVNSKIHEDWSWIAGLESIGTLCIADASEPLQRRKPIPISRSIIVEKIPRKFTFHPGNNNIPGAQYQPPRPVPLVQAKIKSQKRDTSTRRRHVYKRRSSVSLRNSAKLSQEGKQSTFPEGRYPVSKQRCTRFPTIPIRVNGERVNEVNIRNPWDMQKVDHSRNALSPTKKAECNTAPMQYRSHLAKMISQSRAKYMTPNGDENSPFSVKSWNAGDDRIETRRGSVESPPEDTDDEDRVNYEALHSAYFRNRRNGKRLATLK